jgi:hypothetical protein
MYETCWLSSLDNIVTLQLIINVDVTRRGKGADVAAAMMANVFLATEANFASYLLHDTMQLQFLMSNWLNFDRRLHTYYCTSLQKLMMVVWRSCNNTGL